MNESYGIETGYPMNEFRSIEIKLEEFSTFDWHSQKEEGGYILLDDKSLAPMDALDQAVRSIWSLCIRHVQDARELGLPQDNKPRLVGPAVNQAENPSTRDVPW
jgi:hypothetical protein